MATKHTSPSGSMEKISDSIFRSKNNRIKSSRESLKTIFEELLQDTFNAEEQFIKALLEFTKATDNDDLDRLFSYHLSELTKQSNRLSHVTYRLSIENQGTVCKAMQGLIHEAEEIIKKHPFGISRDAALIIALQKVQHYGLAAYGSLVELADVLNLDHIADELEKTLYEKKNLNVLYLDIAQAINDAAYKGVVSEYEVYA